jgi:lysophospholipase L1-like esterase
MTDNSSIKKIGKATVYVAFVLLVIELSSYFIYHSSLMHGFKNGKRIVDIYSSGASYVPALIQAHPYMLYVNNPQFVFKGVKQYNSFGCRNEEFNIEKDSNEYRILCLGGSTTNCFPYIERAEDTWPGILQKKLSAALSGKKFMVINAGLPFGSSAEELAGYVFRYRYLHADMVIMHTGGNDIVPLFYKNYNPEYTHWRTLGTGLTPRPAEKFILHANFMKVLYAIWLNTQQSVFNSYPEDITKLEGSEVLKRVEKQQPVGFERNIRGLVKMIRQDKATPLLVNFVQAREQKLSENQPFLKGKEPAQELGYKKILKVLDSIAQADSVDYIKLSAGQFKDDMFLDNCHLNKEGEKIKADLIFNGIMEKQLIKNIK